MSQYITDFNKWIDILDRSYPIIKIEFYKNMMFLLSRVETLTGAAAMWSTHTVGEAATYSEDEIKRTFQREHDRQIHKLIREEQLTEPDEYKIQSVENLTKN